MSDPQPRTGRSEPARLALVGAGLFGRFILQSGHGSVPQVVPVIVADADADRATQVAADVGCRAATVEEALGAFDVDAVVIADTAAYARRPRRWLPCVPARTCSCEKPLGMNTDQAAQVRALAESLGRVVVVDHVLRYNPLLDAIRRLQHRLGLRPIRFLFENDAGRREPPAATTGSGTRRSRRNLRRARCALLRRSRHVRDRACDVRDGAWRPHALAGRRPTSSRRP